MLRVQSATPSRTPPRRSWTEAQKRQCARRYEWKCGKCGNMLPSTFEIDHIKPLFRGGADDIEANGMPLDANCHRLKTQSEAIELALEKRSRAEAVFASREKVWKVSTRRAICMELGAERFASKADGVLKCGGCDRKYFCIFPHVCPTVDARMRESERERDRKRGRGEHEPGRRKRARRPIPEDAVEKHHTFDRFLFVASPHTLAHSRV